VNNLINIALFKTGWIAVVAAAARNIPLAGTLVIAAIVLVRLMQADNRRAEARLLAAAAAIGFAWESALVSAGLVSYPSGTLVHGVAPYWIVAMWLLFATTLNVSMRWLRRHVGIAIAAGAIGGPLAFWAGASAGAVSFAEPLISLIAIGAGWAMLLPLLVSLAVRFERSIEADRSGQLVEEGQS
jgi:hypothetical protein